MQPTSHFLLALVICGALGDSVSKYFRPKGNIPPVLMQSFLGGELTQRIERVFTKVPNKMCVAHLRAMIYGLNNNEYWATSIAPAVTNSRWLLTNSKFALSVTVHVEYFTSEPVLEPAHLSGLQCCNAARSSVQSRYSPSEVLDASAKFPEGLLALLIWDFGNYEQCLRIQNIRKGKSAFSGQHCFVRICLTNGPECVNMFHETVEKMVPMLKKMENPYLDVKDVYDEVKVALNTTFLRMGVCVPSTCSAEDLEALANAVISQGTKDIRAKVKSFECHTTKAAEYELIDYVALAIYSLMVALIISSTVYDLTHKDSRSRNEMYIVFSAYTNLKKMMISSENNEGSLQCIHGIRFLSIMYVVLGHVYYVTPVTPVTNVLAARDFTRAKISSLVIAAFFSVDTFFVLSGLLVGYVFLNFVAEAKTMNFKVFYIHRLVRLTPTLAAVLLFDISLGSKLSDGPFWHTHLTNDCKTSWWKVLFYVKNYNTIGTCMTTTWYLAADTQLYFLSPLFLLPLWKNPRRGQQLLAVAIFFSWLIPFTYAYVGQYQIPARTAMLITYNKLPLSLYLKCRQFICDMALIFIGVGGTNLQSTTGSLRLYSETQNRFGPWVIGLWLGLILHRLRRGQIVVKLTKRQVIAMWTYVFLMGVACVMSLHPFSQLDREYCRFKDSFYYSSLHLLWASVIFLIIFGCETGYGGPVNWFLSLRMWIPWSRLTYGIYLVHYSILYILDASARTPQEFTHPLLIRKAISVLFLSIIAAAFLSLMFESPVTALERILLRKVRRKDPKYLPKDLEIRNARPNGYTPILPGGDMRN